MGFRTVNRPFLGLTAILVLSGAGLIALTLKQDIRGALRVFLLMTGAAPAGFLVSFLLHNAVYALSMVLFGKKTEETVFFLLAVAVCPLAFVFGAVGSVVLTIM